MTNTGCCWVAVLTVSVTLAAPDALAQDNSSGRRLPWWRNPKIQHELVLTDGQVRLLEQIFQQQLTERIALLREVQRLDLDVQHMLERGEPNDAAAMPVIDRAEQLRLQQNVRRTLMLLAGSRVLTPEQRAKLSAIGGSSPCVHALNCADARFGCAIG
jgi:Spy/CpxP family protein refolding chaperone